MEVGESPRVHEAPALPGRLDGAVVAVEAAATALMGATTTRRGFSQSGQRGGRRGGREAKVSTWKSVSLLLRAMLMVKVEES